MTRDRKHYCVLGEVQQRAVVTPNVASMLAAAGERGRREKQNRAVASVAPGS